MADQEVSSAYSFSLKLGSLFTLPSRMLSQMRRVVELLDVNQNTGRHVVSDQGEWDGGPRSGRSLHPSTFTPLPGPWGFVTSGYAAGLFAMVIRSMFSIALLLNNIQAVLLNRIQNIVVPPPYLFTYRMARTPRTGASLIRSIYYYVLPLDFASTPPRLVFRLPSLYFICRALLMWSVILLQVADMYPSWPRGVKSLGNWVARKEMEEICWSTFCSVCGTLCISALTRGLDGTSANTNNAAPFNMVSVIDKSELHH
jgi:hypothetical protein